MCERGVSGVVAGGCGALLMEQMAAVDRTILRLRRNPRSLSNPFYLSQATRLFFGGSLIWTGPYSDEYAYKPENRCRCRPPGCPAIRGHRLTRRALLGNRTVAGCHRGAHQCHQSQHGSDHQRSHNLMLRSFGAPPTRRCRHWRYHSNVTMRRGNRSCRELQPGKSLAADGKGWHWVGAMCRAAVPESFDNRR